MTSTLRVLPTLPLLLALAPTTSAQSDAVGRTFPPATALEQGLSPDALAGLDEVVAGFVEKDQVVGAELLVIKGGRTVLHTAHGWRDRDEERPMAPGGVFCVRSMTKSVVGVAALRLVDERRLDLDDPVSRFLPSFGAPPYDAITVGHLITHTSGLPLSHIVATDPRTLESVRAVADLGPGFPLGSVPGERFEYSDQGTDTLTAVLEVVAQKPAAQLVDELVLAPLGMSASACVLSEGHPLRARASSKYAGSQGHWTRFWSPEDPPLFPCFLGSQGLYSTAEDYARFLDMLMRKGRVPGARMLKRRTVRRMLTPATDAQVSPTGLPDAAARYGQLAILWMDEPAGDDDAALIAFGHNGSDGTYAWAFPEQDAIILYFTQSRGNLTGLALEEHLGDLLLGVPFDATQVAPPLEQYVGYYWEGEGDQYRAIVEDGDGLALEVLGKGVAPLTYIGEDRWRLLPGRVLQFARDADGVVSGYSIGDHQEFRFAPSAELPPGEDIAQRVADAHRVDRLEEASGVHFRATVALEKLDRRGTSITHIGARDQWRVEERVAGQVEYTAVDGRTAWSASAREGQDVTRSPMEDPRLSESLLDGPWVRAGDWTEHFESVETIQALENSERRLILVRCGAPGRAARTYWVDAGTWRVVREDKVVHVPNAGRLGVRSVFDDYREVAGALLPHRVRVRTSNAMIGEIVITVDEVEVGVETPEGFFELADLGG
ncbi:MAG: serine hydrolase [Planctomycetota bacterium]